MTHDEQRMKLLRHVRIARVKRILRIMPRKATVHKFPVLKWFAAAARKRSYLWCFRVKTVVPALYAGCILALLPIYGIQLPLAVLLAFVLRANLPILASLQFITNPLTVLPVYFTAFQIGRVILNPFGFESPSVSMAEMNTLINSLEAGNWGFNLKYLATIWLVTSLGACVLGTFLGALGSGLYRLAAYEVDVFNKRLKELQQRRMEKEVPGERIPPAHGHKEQGHG
ncbi:MAG: DUF2062 domain-containing protein [Puniceicoccaceae bacterium]